MADSYLLPARVECHAGYRAEEEPRAVWIDGQRKEVAEIVDRWYCGSRDPEKEVVRYFRLRLADGRLVLLRNEPQARVWYLVEPAGPAPFGASG